MVLRKRKLSVAELKFLEAGMIPNVKHLRSRNFQSKPLSEWFNF